jgi:CHAD domain-containing protein
VPPNKTPGDSPNDSLSRSLERALRRVSKEQALAADDLAPEPIHDLRVALRRCRSLAEGFSELNPRPEWRHLQKACKNLLDAMAPQRDIQVSEEWARRLGFDKTNPGQSLSQSFEAQQHAARHAARRALRHFSRKRWKRWRRRLPKLAKRIAAPQALLARLAMRRLKRAHELENRWRLHPSHKSAHRLRVALKRFRYTVESFLPGAAWGADLKTLQDLLGNVHDLDMLRQRVFAASRAKALQPQQRDRWLETIERSRRKAVAAYWRAIILKPSPRMRGLAGHVGSGFSPTGRAKARPDTVSPQVSPRVASEAHAATLWNRWGKKLGRLAGVTFPILEGPSPSRAKQASRAAPSNFRSRGRPRPLSAAR